MLKENPFLHSWSVDAILQNVSWFVSQPSVTLIALLVCAGIAAGALLKVWSDFRGGEAKKYIVHAPDNAASLSVNDPSVSVAASSETGPADNTTWIGDLGYSNIGRGRCQWKRDAIQPFAETTRWVCSGCKAFSFSSDGGPPATCRAFDPKQKM